MWIRDELGDRAPRETLERRLLAGVDDLDAVALELAGHRIEMGNKVPQVALRRLDAMALMPIRAAGLVFQIESEEDDALAAGESGQVERLNSAVFPRSEAILAPREDLERRLAQPVDVGIAGALALAAFDRDAQALKRAIFQPVLMPGPPTTIRVIEDVGLRRDAISVVYGDDRERTAVAIAASGFKPRETISRNETRPSAQNDDAVTRPGALDDGEPLERPSVGAPDDFFPAAPPFCSRGPAGFCSLGPIGFCGISAATRTLTRPRSQRCFA